MDLRKLGISTRDWGNSTKDRDYGEPPGPISHGVNTVCMYIVLRIQDRLFHGS